MDISTHLADIAARAAQSVGNYLANAFVQPGAVEYKADFHDIVTVHDKESQRRIVDVLLSESPESFVVGEESGEMISRHPTKLAPDETDVLWYVDPIDGTSNFAAGFDQWCVSIAAAVGGKVIAGVIYQPTQEILYRADSGGTTRNGEPLQVQASPLSANLVATQYPSSSLSSPETMGHIDALMHTARSVRRPGSTALCLAGVAAGNFAATFNVHTNAWDVAAGIYLVQQAGGIYLGFNDCETRFLPDLPTAPNYVAASSVANAIEILHIIDRSDLAQLLTPSDSDAH